MPKAQEGVPTGNAKVTRQDWLNVAMDILISDGVGEVKVLAIGDQLGVSRSSFYWYFKSKQDLLDSLMEFWESTNTHALVQLTKAPAKTITEAVCNVFKCFVNEALFNTPLDFAVRDWARRSGKVRKILDRSDEMRLTALKEMFERFGYENMDALVRARILYFMQIGYNVAELNETLDDRLKLNPHYVFGFTGVKPKSSELESFSNYAQAVKNRELS